jgi:hypothetical protein
MYIGLRIKSIRQSASRSFKPMRIAYNSLSALLHSLFLPHSGLTDGIHLVNHVAEPKQIKAVQQSMVEPYGDLVAGIGP